MRTPLFAAAALFGLLFGQVSANASVRPASEATHVDASYIVAAGVPTSLGTGTATWRWIIQLPPKGS